MDDLSFLETESKNLAEQFMLQYIELLKRQKDLKNEIKAMRKQFNEMGLPTRLVIKAYNLMKAEKKEDKAEKANIESFKDFLVNNDEVQKAYLSLELD